MDLVHPFKLRDHGFKVIEIIVNGQKINSEHKAVESLVLFPKKFEYIILKLEEGAYLTEDTVPLLNRLGEFEKLKIVNPQSVKLPDGLIPEIRQFKSVADAKARINGERNSDKILDQLKVLAPMQSSARELMLMLRNPDVEFEAIEEVTSKDPTLVTSILKTANSPIYMRRNPVDTLKTAVSFLGIEGIRQIVSHEIFNGFTRFFANQRDRLAHMRRCAHLAAYLGKVVGADQPTIQKIRVAGLMHDIGALALAFYDTHQYARVCAKVRHDKVLASAAELEVFGVDHQELGGRFAKEMGMPVYICEAAMHHHDTMVDKNNVALLAVICANSFLNENIEQVPFSRYEHFLGILGDIANKNSKGKDSLALEPEEDSDVEEVSHSLKFQAMLKQELDEFMATASMDAQGM